MLQPIKEIIPPINSELNSTLQEYSSLITEAVNFGSHMISWDIAIEREGSDNGIPYLFLRNIIEQADSISTLIRNSSIDPALIILRSLIDSCNSLSYLIANNEKQRAYSYMSFQAVETIKRLSKWLSEENSHKDILEKIKNDNFQLDNSNIIDNKEIKETINKKRNLLEKPGFKEAHTEYLRTKKTMNRHQFHWFTLYNGPTNFYKLAEHLKKSLRYEMYYKSYSSNVHGTAIMKGIAYAGNGMGQVIQIRDFENVEELFVHTLLLLTETYDDYFKTRLISKKDEFKEWYSGFVIRKNTTLARNKINYVK